MREVANWVVSLIVVGSVYMPFALILLTLSVWLYRKAMRKLGAEYYPPLYHWRGGTALNPDGLRPGPKWWKNIPKGLR